jgi:hypothetical protein
MTAVVGVVGIFGMLQTDAATTSMYETQSQPIPYLAKVIETLQRIRVNNREYALGAATGNAQQVEDAYTAIQNYMAVMTENLDLYRASMVDPAAIALFDEARAFYDSEYKASLQRSYNLAKAGDTPGIVAEMAAA